MTSAETDWLLCHWTCLLSPSVLWDSASVAACSLTRPPVDFFLSGDRPSLNAPSGVGVFVAMQGSGLLLDSCW